MSIIAHTLHKIYVLLLLGAWLGSCATLPGSQKKALIMIPLSKEKQLGEQAFQEILAKEKRSQNAKLNEILQRVGQRVAAQAPDQGFQWEFVLVESPQMNAFCLPGGKVAFYTGIVPVLENEATMAIVMGHEIAHAVQRHGAQRMSQAMLLQGGMALADLSLQNNQYRSLILGSLGVGASVGVMLPFSRDNESEADVLGLRYAAMAGYDPREAIPFWTRFSNIGKNAGGQPPEFLSTHPSGQTRIRQLEELMPEAMSHYQNSPKYGLGSNLQ